MEKNTETLQPVKKVAKKRTSKKVTKKTDWQDYLKEHPEYLVLNRESALKSNLIKVRNISKKEEAEILSSCADRHKLLLLQFFKDLFHQAGYKSETYKPLGQSSFDYCGVCCEIEWADGKITSGLADAHYNNTYSFTKHFLAPISENRAFVRCVKKYFNIPLLGHDEIGDTPKEDNNTQQDEKNLIEASIGPYVVLKKVAKENLKIEEFSDFKTFLRDYSEGYLKDENIEPWILKCDFDLLKNAEEWKDLPPNKCASWVTKIKKLKNND